MKEVCLLGPIGGFLDSFATGGLCVVAPCPWIDVKFDIEHAVAHPWQISEVVELQLRAKWVCYPGWRPNP
eukprot:50760-Amphidinium_carterae.1